MRFNILVLALLSSAVSAQAGSIDVVVTGKDAARSIQKIGCGECVKKVKKQAPSVVELAPGTQKIVVRDVNGVKKIYRTEAWLGGSPVTYVSKAMPDDPALVAEETPVKSDDVATAPVVTHDPAAEADMIDEKSKTSAVTADMGAEIKVEVAPKAASFDPGKMELRIN